MGTTRGPDPVQEALARLAAKQHGIFTRAQAMEAGATRRTIYRRCETGRWLQVHPGVFAIAGTPPSWHRSLIAACFAWGEGALVSHRAAAGLWGLPNFGPGIVELTVPRGRKRTHAEGMIVHERPRLSPSDVRTIHQIPVTGIRRTLLDIAGLVPRSSVEEALDDALRRKLLTVGSLGTWLNERGGRGMAGTKVLRALLAARDGGAVPESVLETRWLRTMRDAGLPEPVRQYAVRDGDRIVAIVDFAYPDLRIGIEPEGFQWHGGRARWARDLNRRNELTRLGWTMIHVTWNDLARPERVLDAIRAALARANVAR